MSTKHEVDAGKAIRWIAREKGLTVQQVRAEMSLAILSGLENQDPVIRVWWKSVPRKGGVPTPEEFIAYLAAQTDPE